MCSAGQDMAPEAQEALADLLRDIARALDPEHPELVRVGPVDFGTAPLRHGQTAQSDDAGMVSGG